MEEDEIMIDDGNLLDEEEEDAPEGEVEEEEN